jgi:hypothetical protein
MANLTRRQAQIAALMRDRLEWRLDRRPRHNKPSDLDYTRYDKMARRWAVTPNILKSPRRSAPPRPFCLMQAVAQLRVHCCWSCSEATFQSSALVCVAMGPEAPGGVNSETTS